MAKHSISEAAKLTGKARSTLHRHLKQGKLSKESGVDGQPVIDTSELVRVYGPLHGQDSSETVAAGQGDTARDTPFEQSKVEALLEAQIARLTADLADARQERDDWKNQAHEWRSEAQKVSGLLTNQTLARPPQASLGERLTRFWRRAS